MRSMGQTSAGNIPIHDRGVACESAGMLDIPGGRGVRHEPKLSPQQFQTVAAIIAKMSGIELDESKYLLTQSRLSKRLLATGIANYETYCRFVQTDKGAQERLAMLEALTTNVTRFYRESHHFEYLAEHIIPGLIQRAIKGAQIRIWSAGCSSGEEPYTLAMLLFEEYQRVRDLDLKILGSDIDRNVLQVARAGRYNNRSLGSLPEAWKTKYFESPRRTGGDWTVSDKLRELISFNHLNLMGKWPMKRKFDVIFCRNVVIYFNEDTQQKLWTRFCDQLQPNGHLFLGHSERVTGSAIKHFKACATSAYQKI